MGKYDLSIAFSLTFSSQEVVSKNCITCWYYQSYVILEYPENPSCINLILTNKPQSFYGTYVMETGLSDFHRMTVTILKIYFHKLPPKVISYRDFKKFENQRFMDSYIWLYSQFIDYTKNPDLFFNICQNELNHHAPRKKKYICGNNKPFMTKTLFKSIMERSHFRFENSGRWK